MVPERWPAPAIPVAVGRRLIRKVCDEARSGDLIVIMSNGGFGGIYTKLPAALSERDNALHSARDRNSINEKPQ